MNVLSQFGLAQPRSEVPPTGGGTAAGILGQFGLAPLGRPPPPPPKEERGEKREEETTLDKSEPPREADTLEADVVRK